ncbi:glutamate receptor 2-like [Amphibalanus amphitrite]|uniref:glutamate receptor 2-like n=1 Tax=Amphibalanus amphitrite TaxID=1232801 RepID=UPI001C91E065|nr:glutamate receptor 2-like [Amphibalanus amphitrite]
MEAVTRSLLMMKMLVVVLVLPPTVLPTSQLLTELPAEGGCRSEPLSAALAALLTLNPPSEVTIVGTDSGREAAGCLTRRLWAAGVATAHETASSEHGGGTLAVLGTARDVAAAYRRVRPPGPVHRTAWFVAVLGNVSEVAAPLAGALHESQRVTVALCPSAAGSPCALLASSSPGDGSVRLSAVGAVTDGRVTLSAPPPDWRLRHLGGRPLRVALTTAGAPSEPCTHDLFGYRPLPDGGAHFCGYLGETFALLAAHLRFRIEAKIIGGCGMTLTNGSAYGRLAALQRGEADIGVGSCTVMYERVRAVDMAEWHWTGTTTFASASLRPASSAFLLFEVYRPAVWALVLALAPAAAALRWLTAAAERRCRLPSRRQRWSPLLLESVALLSGQGVSARGAGAAGRTVVFFLYVVTVTLAAVYAGNLTAFLSLPRWQPPLDSLEQLADSDVQPHVVRGHSQFHMFQNQTTGARGRIWAKMTACPDCIHRSTTSTYTTSFLKRIACGEAVLFQSPRSLINRAHRLMEETGQTSERCPFHLARENLRRDFYAMMLQKNSMYTPLLDDSIRWLKQFGIVQYLYRRNVPSRCGGPATGAAVSAAPKMNLSVLRGPFFCWMGGMALACVAFFVERLSAFGSSKPTVLQGNVK